MELHYSLKCGIALCAAILGGNSSVAAQGDPAGITKASMEYHKYRLIETKPPFEYWKVKALVDKIRAVSTPDSDATKKAISAKDFEKLSTPAKFTYCMIQPEDYSQNCDGMPAFLNEQNLIFARPAEPYGGEGAWSDRQMGFFTHHRAETVALLRSTIRSSHRVCCNLKAAIVKLNAAELIPDAIESYKQDRKDHDILSMLCELMKDAKFRPFGKASFYKKFYGEDASYQASLPYSRAVEELILSNSMQFYKSHKLS